MATATKAKAASLVLEFTFAKDTKGTNVYKENEPDDGSRPVIGSIYVTKPAVVKHSLGRKLRVTVENID